MIRGLLAGVLVLCCAAVGLADEAPRDAGVSVTLAELLGTSWRAEQIGGQPALGGSEPTLAFQPEEVSGSGGCNRFHGAAVESAGTVEFGPLAATRRACRPPVMDQEQRWLMALARTARLERGPGSLLLKDSEGRLLARLTPADTPEAPIQ